MERVRFAIEIKASREIVWNVLWKDETFRAWADIIDEGTFMKGALVEGRDVEFISSINGYGVTSRVHVLRENEFVLFRHQSDTMSFGDAARANEWTGGEESYTLAEKGGCTILTVDVDLPSEQVETFLDRQPRALECVKRLAEARVGE